MSNLRYLVIGAGAIGGLVGGKLAAQGRAVSVVARVETIDRLREEGLTVKEGEQTFRSQPAVYLTAGEALAAGADVILLAVKGFDTGSAIAELQASGQPVPPIVCLQNGVDNEPALAAAFGADRVIAATVTTAVSVPAAGVVVIEKARGLGVAEGHALSKPIAADLTAAGFNVRMYANADAMKWSKLLGNLTANATSAICDLPPRALFQHDGLYDIEIDMLREALTVMQAKGIPAVDLPGGPMRLLAFGVRNLPRRLYRPYFSRAFGGARGEKMPSFHIDLSRGGALSEVDWLNGAVVRHGQAVGVPTPVNAALTDILTGLMRDRSSWGQFRGQPAALVAAIRRK